MEPPDQITLLLRAYWEWDYDRFVEALGLNDDQYAFSKWLTFRKIGAAMTEMGDLLPVIAEEYADSKRP